MEEATRQQVISAIDLWDKSQQMWESSETAGGASEAEVLAGERMAALLRKLLEAKRAGFTRDEAMAAVNAGATLVTDDTRIDISDRDNDLVNLVVNAIGAVLDDPDVTLDQAIERGYGDGVEPVCKECGLEVMENEDGTRQHGYPGYPERLSIYADADADHTPDPESIADTVRGWL